MDGQYGVVAAVLLCLFVDYNRTICVLRMPSANVERHPIAINLVRFAISQISVQRLNIYIYWSRENLSLLLTPKNANCLGLFRAINLITLLTSTQKSDNEIYVYSDVRPITFRHSRQYSQACFEENGLFGHEHNIQTLSHTVTGKKVAINLLNNQSLPHVIADWP